MNTFENREIVVNRLKRELIGPGSDLFLCNNDYSDEVIEGKPLQRYYSGILFPKQLDNGFDDGKDVHSEESNEVIEYELDTESTINTNTIRDPGLEEDGKEVNEEDNEDNNNIPKYNSNSFYPSHFGLSFCIGKACKEFNVIASFGNYKKAKYDKVLLPYSGIDLALLDEFGFSNFVAFDNQTKTLRQTKDLKRKAGGRPTPEYALLQASFKSMRVDHRNTSLYKHLTKLLFKDKYKRFDNIISLTINIDDLLNVEQNHIELVLSKQSNVNSENWHKDNRDNLVLHIKLYASSVDKYYIRVVIENKFGHKKDQFSLSKEKLNQLALFQTEIKIESQFILPFRDYRTNLYKTDEDRMLDYLFRDKLAYGIGHNVSCTWNNFDQDGKQVFWIKSTYLPLYDVRSKSTETENVDSNILKIKNLSSYNTDTQQIIKNLQNLADAYLNWIKNEKEKASNNEYGLTNIKNCEDIYNRMINGIKMLSKNDIIMQAFQLANTAIYIQMFQTELNFIKKDGYEVFERSEKLQLSFSEYGTTRYPNGKPESSWRPFQLAFILQCIPSFVEENSKDKDLVDLLYYPTGGGKTEAYLALSAFIIFWRRLVHKNDYDGVNIILRYTLRLLSAQQFERATKLILACEFIRRHKNELGDKKISIGFWIGAKTIPNKHKIPQGNGAFDKYNKTLIRLNKGESTISPFQVSNCQWCNTKIISRISEQDKNYLFGHRHNGNKLQTHCLNPNCYFNETNGGLPIFLIDEDIYNNPPTMLFGTVDKFAQLTWQEDATYLFNYKNNRKPELIIQDELHLLNGPLGSLVGLFENVILSLCTTEKQKPKIIASTATVKNVGSQIEGLYGREVRIFPQYATNSDDTFFSKTIETSKRRYVGVMPTGKTTVMTNLQLMSALLYSRLEVWETSQNKKEADQFWTLLSYFKSLKELGRFSNKISSELKPVIQQIQVRYIKNQGDYTYNHWKLSDRNLELTSRIKNEKIKKNLDKLEIEFDGSLKDYKAYDVVLATNMISVGLDVGRLGIMVMNGMPPNTAEYIQASSRVARRNEGLVITLFDPFNTRDLSYYEDFVQFHKTFYKQVEPLSVTPFADSALDKMLFTLMIAFFRHRMNYAANNMADSLNQPSIKEQLREQFSEIFRDHPCAKHELTNIIQKIDDLIKNWQFKIDAKNDLKYYWYQHPKDSLMKPAQEKNSDDDILVAMQSMRNVEPNAEISIRRY